MTETVGTRDSQNQRQSEQKHPEPKTVRTRDSQDQRMQNRAKTEPEIAKNTDGPSQSEEKAGAQDISNPVKFLKR